VSGIKSGSNSHCFIAGTSGEGPRDSNLHSGSLQNGFLLLHLLSSVATLRKIEMAKFVEFVLVSGGESGTGNSKVYINPDHITHVSEVPGQRACIHIGEHRLKVDGKVEAVLQLLNS
jgi:hypothetical protein